jgi:hypothetical protein
MTPQLNALGTLFEAMLPLYVDRAAHGYVVLHERDGGEVTLAVQHGVVKRVEKRGAEQTLLSLTGTVESLKTIFSGGFARALERGDVVVTGDASFFKGRS